MPENDTVVEYGEGYKESDDFVPNPTDQFGTLDTSDTAGRAHAKIEEISPIFEVARKQDLAAAQRALDPDDPDVPASMVVLPQGQALSVVDEEKVKDDLKSKAGAATSEKVNLASYRGPAQKAAAESGSGAGDKAESERLSAMRGGTDGGQGAGGSSAGNGGNLGGGDGGGDNVPNKSDSKAEWKAYAISQGMSEEEAESTSRDDLAKKYGKG